MRFYIFLFLFFLFFISPAFADEDNVKLENTSKQIVNQNTDIKQEKKSFVFYIKEGVIYFDRYRFSKHVNLKKSQIKKIEKLYNKYLKTQLKFKSKITIKSIKLTEIDYGYDDDLILESEIKSIYIIKSKMFFNNYRFLKKVEKELKKDQRAAYNKLVSYLYRVKC